MKLHLWGRLNRKITQRISEPRYAGFFCESDVLERGMRFICVNAKREAVHLRLYWMVDETDGVIADAKFQAFGPPALIAVGDILSELVLRKNYDQASRLSADLIDRSLRMGKEEAALPEECAPLLNLALDALDAAVHDCLGIPFASTHETTPIEEGFGESSDGIPGWEEFVEEKKLKIIDEVVDKEIRPYIELDAGGINVLGLGAGGKVRISYEGSCTSCPSSAGSTLSAIQRILRSRVHPTLSVVPEF